MALTWLKKGEASADLATKEAAEAAKRKEEQGKMWRFYLKDKEEARITFVDGVLGEKGSLVPPRFYEHTVYFNGSWTTFVCPAKSTDGQDKCPICEGGDRPSLVAMFTIIDHRVFKSTNGKEYTNTPRLYPAKSITFEMLNKLAQKRGGLAGTTWDVSRVGDKAAAVGSMFDFVEKSDDIEALKAKYTRTTKDEKTGKETTHTIFVPADYDTEIVYRTGEQLLGLGLGKAPNVGMVYKVNEGGNAPEGDYASQL